MGKRKDRLNVLLEDAAEFNPVAMSEQSMNVRKRRVLPSYCSAQSLITFNAVNATSEIDHICETLMVIGPCIPSSNDILCYGKFIFQAAGRSKLTSWTKSAATAPMEASLSNVPLFRSLSLIDLTVRSW